MKSCGAYTQTRLLSLLFLSLITLSCSPLKQGNVKFKNGEYNSAIAFYKSALHEDQYHAEINFRIAESYRLSNRLKESKPYYKAAISSGWNDESADFYYALSLKAYGEYDSSRQYLEKYLRFATNEVLMKRADEELDNLDNIDHILNTKNHFKISNLDFLNTEAIEYSPIISNEIFYFTSNRSDERVYKATGSPFTDLYQIDIEDNTIKDGEIKPLQENINLINANEGSITFSRDGNTMIFARGNTGKRKGTSDVNLYISRFRNNKWSEPKLLNINNEEAWDSTPAFSKDGKTLYFASNRKGGYGGLDLYSAKIDPYGRFGRVKNMGKKINTKGNEMFPYVSNDGKLYFSSTGHPGLGGLDLFQASKKKGKVIIKNMGAPINSIDDDFGIIFTSAYEGYFSSNREGGKGDDDIYSFYDDSPDHKTVNYLLSGRTLTEEDNGKQKILPGVKVKLKDAHNRVLKEVTTGETGLFNFKLKTGKNYTLIGEKKEYFTTRLIYSMVGRSIPPEELTEQITNITYDTLLVLNKIILDKSIVLENIYYNLDKAEIREDAKVELDRLVNLMKDNPNIKIELSSHTDIRAGHDYNMQLSQRRAESAVNYIAQNGISIERLKAMGYGETQLLIKNAETEEEHQKNRRTEFKVIDVQ